MKRMKYVLLVLCSAVLAFSGCAQSTPTQSVSASPTASAAEDYNETGILHLVWEASKGTDSLFESPWAGTTCMYPFMVFDALIATDSKGDYIPRLAKEWSISEDGTEYTFTLDETAVWHDGEPFTADDVIFSLYSSIADPGSTLKNGLLQIQGAKEVSEGATSLSGVSAEGNKVKIKLLAADNSIMTTLSILYILPKHLLGNVAIADLQTDANYWKKPIGTGAYKIDEVSFPDYFTCVRNENYFRNHAAIKKVLFTSYATGGNDAVVAALIAGKIDYAFGGAINDIAIAKNIKEQNDETKYIVIPAYQVRSFVFNLAGSEDKGEHPGIQDESVRQAFNLLLDKDAIAGFYGEQAAPMTTFVNDSHFFYNEDIVPFKRNVEKAKEMLKAANFDFSKTIRICYYYSDQTTSNIMELIKQNFADAGVKCETFLATGDLASILYKIRNYDIAYVGGGSNDPVQLYRRAIVGNAMDALLGNNDFRQGAFNIPFNSYLASTNKAQMKEYADILQATSLKYSGLIPIYSLNKLCLYNTARLELPEEIFSLDNEAFRDWQFENWKLLKAD